jgi:hypothetical protein
MMKSSHVVAGFLVLIVATVMFMGCGGSVSLKHVWSDPAHSGQPLNNFLVVGLAQRRQVRSQFEFQLQHELKSRGVGAKASVDGLPPDVKLDKETFQQYFGGENIDAVLVTGLISADTTDLYTPGISYATNAGYYRTWDGYVATVWDVHQQPGYWTESTEYVLESNLYDVATARLIWRGISKTVDPENVSVIIVDLSKTLVDQLAKDGLITVQETK